MASPFKQFATDPELEKNGVWLKFGDFQIKVARAGGSNAAFLRANELHFKDHKRAAEADVLPESVAMRQLILVYADAVILDWRSVNGYNADDSPVYVPTIEGPDGEDMAYSRDNVIKLLTATSDTMFPIIREHAEKFHNFRKLEREIDAKN